MQDTRSFTVIVTGDQKFLDMAVDDLRVQVKQMAEGHARLEGVRIIVTKADALAEIPA